MPISCVGGQLEAVAESQSGAVDSKSWNDPVELPCVNTTPIVDCFEPQDSSESLVPQPEEETAEKSPPKTNRSLLKLARENVKALFDGHGHMEKAEFTLESVEPDQRFMMYLAMMDEWHTEAPEQEKSFDLSYLNVASSTANRALPSIYHSFPAVNRSESSASSGLRDKESLLQVDLAVEQVKPDHQIGIVSDLDVAQGMRWVYVHKKQRSRPTPRTWCGSVLKPTIRTLDEEVDPQQIVF